MGSDVRAFMRSCDVATPDALEAAFGRLADKLLGSKALVVGEESRVMLVEAIRQAYLLVMKRVERGFDGDYSPDDVCKRFPPWNRSIGGVNPHAGLPMQVLIDRWKEKQRASRSPGISAEEKV
jgi:hypothetical protein